MIALVGWLGTIIAGALTIGLLALAVFCFRRRDSNLPFLGLFALLAAVPVGMFAMAAFRWAI